MTSSSPEVPPAESQASLAEARRVLDADGRLRPVFLLDFPRDPELDALVSAFEQGDFYHVRKNARLLLARSQDPNVRTAAEELQRRTAPDPLLKLFLAVAVLLFLFLTLWAYL